MAKVKDYVSGKVLDDAKLALTLAKYLGLPVLGSIFSKQLLKAIKPFEPKLINLNIAKELIRAADKCAVGERVCRAINNNSKLTESVFLDELAEGMVKTGKAEYMSKQEAINILKKYNNPLLLSKVSNKYTEICCSVPKGCVYWNIERKGYKVLTRIKK